MEDRHKEKLTFNQIMMLAIIAERQRAGIPTYQLQIVNLINQKAEELGLDDRYSSYPVSGRRPFTDAIQIFRHLGFLDPDEMHYIVTDEGYKFLESLPKAYEKEFGYEPKHFYKAIPVQLPVKWNDREVVISEAKYPIEKVW